MKLKGILKAFVICIIILFVVAFIMVVAYAFNPNAKAGMDYYIGPIGQNIIQGVTSGWAGLTASDFWVTYLTPPLNVALIWLVGGILLTVIVLNPIKDSVTGWFAARHKVGLPTTTGSIVSGTGDVRTTTPIGATTRPTLESPTIQPEVKKEETKA